MEENNNSFFDNIDMKSTLINKNNLDLFGSDIFEAIHWGKLYVQLFHRLFSTYSADQTIDTEMTFKAMVEKFDISTKQVLRIDRSKKDCFKESDPLHSEKFIILRNGLCVVIHEKGLYVLYDFNTSMDQVLQIAGIAEQFKIHTPVKKKFFMVSKCKQYGMSLQDFDVKEYAINIEDNYNDDFKNVHKVIMDSLSSENHNGIVLLHGNYGSGKTYYIRHLINTIDKKFIYLPLHMIDWISTPEFLPFMAEQTDSVLILEDCEHYLMHRESGNQNTSGLSNLLNLGDGLLSDALSINIICTFNAGLKKIDDAFLRKGRLIARYEFMELEIIKAQRLANKLNKIIKIETPMNLSEIYNIEQDNFENHNLKKIGFAYA